MLKRMAAEDSEADTASTTSNMSSEFENLRLDFSSPGTPAMASVFSGSSDGTATDRSASDARSSLSGDSSSRESRGSGSSKFSFHRRSSSHGSVDRQKQKEDGLSRWLTSGTVIYKSVGLGLMDLAVGMHLIKVASDKKIGFHISGF
jgi:hypothetical protein